MFPKGRFVGGVAVMAGLVVMAGPAEASLCYARDYDTAHLVKHVDQRVTRITVRLLADNGSGIGVGLWFRGDKRQWWAGGGCRTAPRRGSSSALHPPPHPTPAARLLASQC